MSQNFPDESKHIGRWPESMLKSHYLFIKTLLLTFVWLSQGPLSIYVNTGILGNTPGNREVGYLCCDRNNVFAIILNLQIDNSLSKWMDSKIELKETVFTCRSEF